MPGSHRMYGGAHAVAVIFKLASIVVIIGGVISLADLRQRPDVYRGQGHHLRSGYRRDHLHGGGSRLLRLRSGSAPRYRAEHVRCSWRENGAVPFVAQAPTMPAPSIPAFSTQTPAFSTQAPAFPQPGWYADPAACGSCAVLGWSCVDRANPGIVLVEAARSANAVKVETT